MDGTPMWEGWARWVRPQLGGRAGGRDPSGGEGQVGGTPVGGMGKVGGTPAGCGDEHAPDLSQWGRHRLPPNADHRYPVFWPVKASGDKVRLCCFRLLICF